MKNIKKLQTKPFQIFDDEWALLTSGDYSNHNSMTIAWGGMGTLWHKNVVTVYVKPCRYTYSFMESNEYFVVSFFDKKYKSTLALMGSISGRDTNKDERSGLTPIKYKNVTLYKESKISFICHKIYFNDLDLKNIPSKEIERYYKEESPHRMYVGEVVEIIEEGFQK